MAGTGHQPRDREGARRRDVTDAARPRRRGDRMRRREFITLLGGAVVAERDRCQLLDCSLPYALRDQRKESKTAGR